GRPRPCPGREAAPARARCTRAQPGGETLRRGLPPDDGEGDDADTRHLRANATSPIASDGDDPPRRHAKQGRNTRAASGSRSARLDVRAIVEIVWLSAFTGYATTMARAFGIESDGFCELAHP